MKTDSAALELAVEEAKCHLALMGKLDKELVARENKNIVAAIQEASMALAKARATKLEYWVCNTFFSTKDALDKKDITLKYATEFDAPPVIEGGREAWIHDSVIKMEKQMLDVAGESKAADNGAQGKKRKKPVAD